MSANVMNSLLPPSQAALTHRQGSPAAAETPPQGGFDTLLAGFDQQDAQGVEGQAITASKNAAGSSSSAPRTATEVDAAHSAWTSRAGFGLPVDPLGAVTIDQSAGEDAIVEPAKTNVSSPLQRVATSRASAAAAPPQSQTTSKLDAALSLLGSFPHLALASSSTSAADPANEPAPLPRSRHAAKPAATVSSEPSPAVITGKADAAPLLTGTPSNLAPVPKTASAVAESTSVLSEAGASDQIVQPSTSRIDVALPPGMPAHATTATTLGGDMGAISYATKTTLTLAPDLGFQSLQTRTFLAAAGRPNGTIAGLQALTPDAIVSGAGAELSPIAGSVPTSLPTPIPTPRSASAARASISAVDAAPTPVPIAPAGAAPAVPAHSRPEERPSRSANEAIVAPEGSPAEAVAAPAATGPTGLPVAASSASAATPVSLADLADSLLNEASTLGKTPADPAKPAAAPIKQLELNLDPAHLGAVAVTLKMTNGKLSVDVGVASSQTQAEVEGQRDSIVARLQTGAQPLESFVVHQQVFNHAAPTPMSSDNSQAGVSDDASGRSASGSETRDGASRQPRAPTPDATPPSGGGRGDWLV